MKNSYDPFRRLSQSYTVVLASGGIDSSTLLTLLKIHQMPSLALFVDYGQASAEAEELAVRGVCNEVLMPLKVVRLKGTSFGPGEIRGRNAFLLHMALMEFPYRSGTTMIGIHSGVNYRDCSPEFVELIQRSFEFHTAGAISVTAPFIDWTKQEIINLALDLGVPIAKTYSCEAGNEPCGRCCSCLERVALGLEEHHERA